MSDQPAPAVTVRQVSGLNEYQNLAAQTGNKSLTRQQAMTNYALGLGEEVSEWGQVVAELQPELAGAIRHMQVHASKVQGLVKKHVFHGHVANRDDFVKEAGDILWYLSQVADTWKVTLEEIANANIEKLAKRYPGGFSQEASKNRVEYQREAA